MAYESDGFDREFTPDTLNLKEIHSQLVGLEEGEALFLTHSGVVINVAGIKIGLDIPSFVAQTHPTDQTILFPPSIKDSLTLNHNSKYKISAFPNHSQNEVALVLGDTLDHLAFSHLDPDHFSGPLYNEIANQNQSLKIFGPTGTRAELSKYNDHVPESFREIYPHQHALSSHPLETKNQIILKKNGVEVTLTSFETPHQSIVKHNQSLLIESAIGDRILFISDAALSPEILRLVSELHTDDHPLSRIIISGGKYNPEDLYHILSEKKAKMFRDGYEEAFTHSAYLPFVLLGLTGGKVHIDLVHHGFYHKQVRNRENFPYRIPLHREISASSPNIKSSYTELWATRFIDKIYRTLYKMKMPKHILEHRLLSLSELTPLTGDVKTTNLEQKINDIDTRLRFSRRIRRWLDMFPVPLTLVESHVHLPKPGEVITTR